MNAQAAPAPATMMRATPANAGLPLFGPAQPFAPPPAGSGQGPAIGDIIHSISQNAALALPGLLLSLLSVQPLVQQAAQLSLPTAPGGLFAVPAHPIAPFAGAGRPAQFAAPVDFGAIAQNASDVLTPQIPAIVNKVLSQVLGRQPTMH